MKMQGGFWSSGEGPSDFWFGALVTLLTLAVAGHCMVGATQRWRPLFAGMALLSMVVFEYVHLFYACVKLPSGFRIPLYRWDCIGSARGGKRVMGSEEEWDENPCWCQGDATCLTGGTPFFSTPEEEASSSCPLTSTSGIMTCVDEASGRDIPPYLDAFRGCEDGQERRCTLQQPCVPCELESVEKFLSAGYRTSRCSSCVTGVHSGVGGDCAFVLNEGPYCLREPHSPEVEPCRTCCSESRPLWINGTCY